MKRLPALLSLLLFLALCASVAYWLLQWLAPAPRPVAAPPVAQRPVPPLSAAYTLFGGNPQSGATTVQLRGIIHSGRAADSVAIIAVEGKPPRALHVRSEVTPGVELKEIRTRAVILAERGGDREVMLPEFSATPIAAQTGADANASPQPVAVQPPPSPPASPASQQPVQSVQPPQVVQGAAQGATASGPGNTGSSAEGAENTVHAPGSPAIRTPR